MTDEELQNLLLASNLIKQEELQRAIEETKKLKRPLENILIESRLLSRTSLYETIAKSKGFNYLNLDNFMPGEELLKIMPPALSQQTQAIPVKIENGTLQIAMTEPSDLYSIDQIQMHTGMPLDIYLSSSEEIRNVLNKINAERSAIADMLAGLTQGASEAQLMEAVSSGSSIVKLVDVVLAQAVRDHASDIHIEPEQDITRIRFRIDGILHEIPTPPKEWEMAMISRIKVLSGMDIAESRVPQDGHFQAKIDDKIIDFRVSTVPTIYGENMVMRILDTSSVMIGLEKLGFTTYEEIGRAHV